MQVWKKTSFSWNDLPPDRRCLLVGQGSPRVQSGILCRPHLAITGWTKLRASPHIAIGKSIKLNAIVSSAENTSNIALICLVRKWAMFEIRRQRHHAHADQRDQQKVAGIEPDRRREGRVAADHDGR